jgi:hypothetical protein
MRIYSLQAPDGNIYDLQAPEGASEQQLTATLYSLKPEAAQPFVKESGVIAQGKKGIEQLVSGIQTTGDVAFGDKNEAARNALARQAEFDRKYEQSPSLERTAEAFKQKGFFSGLGQLASDAPEVIAAQIPQFGLSYAGGRTGAAAGSKLGSVLGGRGRAIGAILGGVAGTVGASYPGQLAGNVETQAEEQVSTGKPIDINVPAAAGAAVPQAALDAVANLPFFGRGIFGKMLGIPEAALVRGSAESVERLAKESLAATITKGTTIGFAAEFPTEIIQQAIQRYQAGKPLTGPEAYKEYGEIAYQTALLSPLGTAGRALDKRGAKAQVQQKAYEEQQIADAEAQKAAQQVAPVQPQDIAGRYQAAEKRKAELKGQIRKVEEGSVTETADRLYNKELEEQIKAMAPELEQLATEYNQFQKTAPAPEAAAPEVTEAAPEESKPTRALTVGDSLDSPLGRFTKEELTSRSPKIAAYVDMQRKKMGKPGLNDYSIEDIRDAMPGQLPEAEKADLNSLIAAKTGYTGEVIYKPEDVVNIAKQKNINTDAVGFKYFLQRATGDNDLSSMSQPQLHSAFKSLSELPKYEETQNLPEKSSVTHYSPDQYRKAVDKIKSLTTDGILPSAKAQEVAKQASGLKRDSDVQYMLQSAYRNGDLDLDSNGNFIRVNPVPQSEFRIEEGFEPAEPTGFNVMRGDKVLFSTQNEAEAKAKAKTLGDSAAPTISQVDKSIGNEQKTLSASQRSLDAMEANGLFGTPEYNKASAKHTAMVEESAKKVGELNKTKEYLQQEVTVKAGKKAANVKAFTTKEKGVSEKSFATREEALKHAIENHTVARLNEIAAETKSPGLKARISKELERRKGTKPFLAAEKPTEKLTEKPAEEPLVTAQKESIKSNLLPMLKKFGLGDVALQIEAGMKEEGSYTASTIKVALDANNPIRVLRHESIHGLKDLGFFTDGQWKVLENQADKVWIDKYLKERNIDGRPLEAGQQSRYEAYVDLYKGDMQAVREEAIADAFGDFDLNGSPKGVFTTLLNKMRQFFEALRNSFNGAGYTTSNDVFGKVERGELSAGKKAGTAEKVSVRNTNKGLLNPNISPKYEKIINDVANEMELTPEEFASTSLINQTGKAGVDQFESNKIGGLPEVVQFLQDQRRKSGLPLLDLEKPADRKIVAKLMATEAMAAIRSGGANLEWYDSTINKTLAMAGLKYPELNTDINARTAFKISTAITSQGLNVEDNLKFAMKVYDQFRLNGKFPEIGQGADQGAMTSNFKLANYLMDDMGPNLMRQFLETEFTVEEMRSAGFNVAGELGDEKVLGSSVFGPKIGFGFYSNLNGNFDPVTMDMWFMRTIGRLTGKLKSFRQDLYDAQLDKFKNELDTEGSNGVFANQFDQNEIDLAKVDDKAAENLARKVKIAHDRDYKINRAAYDDGTREKSKLVAASEIMIKSLDSPKDAPSNGSERRNLRDVVKQMADIVEEKYGKRVPPASLQAAIWYPEQELYKSMGVKLRVTSQNYAGAIEKILTGEGYGESDLSAAAKLGSRTTQQLAKSAVAKGTQATGAEPVRLGPLQAEEKEALLYRGRKRVVLEEEKETPKRKRVIFEVAPDPNNKALTAKWKSLSNDERVEISEKIGNSIIKNALNKFGLKGYVDTQIGSYLDDTNPSFALYLESGDSVAMANFLGYALSQDSMMVVSPKEAKGLEKTGAVRIKIGDASAKDVDKIYQQLREIEVDGEKPVGGQSYMNGHMVVLNYSNVPTNQLASLIESKLGGDYEIITEDVYTAFPEKKDYDYANSSSDPRGNSGVLRQASRNLRSEATRLLQKELTGKQKSVATSPAAKAAGNLKNVVTDKTLIEAQTELNQYDENLFNEQVTPAQRSRANKALAPYISLAEQEKPAFDAMVERIGNDVGIQVRPDPIKNIVRAAEKLVLETENGTKNPDASLILDLLRTTIVVNNEAEIPNAIKQIKKSFDVVRVKDRFKNPALTGYRDFLVNVKLPSGLIAEIQVNIPAMIGSKSTGHKLYRMSRNMEQGSSKRTYLEGLSRRLYNEAYRFSQNDISSASARDALLRKTSEGKDLFGSSAKTTEPSSSLRTGVASTAQTVAPFGTSNITSPTKNGSITKASLRTSAKESFASKPTVLSDDMKAQLRDAWMNDSSVSIPVDMISIPKSVLDGVLENFDKSRYSKSDGPIDVWLQSDGHLLVADGNHRYVKAVLDGKKEVEVSLLGEGYSDNYTEVTDKNGVSASPSKEKASLRTNVTEDIKNMPNGAAIFAAINRTTQTRQEVGFIERLTEALAPESFSYLRQKGLDRYNRLSDVERLVAKKMGGVERLADSNAHAAALQSDLAAGVAASALGVGDRIGGIPVYKDGYTTVSNENGTIKGAVAIFAPLARYGDPKMYQAYQFWAASKRGKRLLANGKEELFTQQDFEYAKQLEQKYPEFVSVQKDWIKYNDGLVKYAVDTGVISAQNAAEFVKYSDYLPFYRQIDGERTIGPNIFQSISGVKAPKKITGSDAPLADFLETVVRNTQATIQAGMKNVAAKKAADAGVFIGMVQKLDNVSSSPNTITILEKGQKVSYECADRLWVDAVSSLNLPELPFLSIFAKPADLLRNLITKDPGFMLANLMRDSVSAYVTSGAKITPLVSTMKEFGSVLMNSSPEYQKLLSAGVLGGYEFSRDIEASTSEFAKDIRKKTGTKTTLETAASPFTLFWGALEKGTTASDAATRIAIYKATLAETGNEAEALHRSLEVLNFNRKGSSAVVRIAAAVIPFLNARVQGLDVFFRSGIRPFFNKDATAMEKQVQKAMFIRGSTIMAMSAMYAAAIAGNPDYENQEEEVKDNNWIIPLGEGRAPLKIPIPFEVGTLFKTVPERIYRSFYGMDTNKDSAEAAKRALSNTFGISPLPQFIAPYYEVKSNYSLFTGREIVSGNMKDVAPEYQVGANTSKVAQELGMATGMSPMKLEYLYKGYTGTMGMYALDLLDASITSLMPDSGVQRASKRFEQMPVIKRFFADPEARGKITAYYDLKNSVDSVVRTVNFLEKSNDPTIAQYVEKNAMLYAAKDFINDLNKQMQDLQDQANMVRSADIPPDEKREILLEITKAQNLLVNDIRAIRKIIQP